MSDDAPDAKAPPDPRNLLATWANNQDEWARFIVRLVLSSGRALSSVDLDTAYALFLQEKGFEKRALPTEADIAVETDVAEREATLVLDALSEVKGVNAIVPGSTIELNQGLTILFGENGTGKTGYVRVLKLMADCRTADDILPNINDSSGPSVPSASVQYHLGDDERTLQWQGERGQAPFTRMPIFDSPAVNFHIDDDLDYVYTPASLSLFGHVTNGIKGLQKCLDQEIKTLSGGNAALLSRFDRKSSLYAAIETIGAATDLDALEGFAKVGDGAADHIKTLQLAVASLRSNAATQGITIQQRRERVFVEAKVFTDAVTQLSLDTYNAAIKRLGELRADYESFRSTLFAAAALPAGPDESWEDFVRAGDAYRAHLERVGVHDESRCVYCRQPLNFDALELVGKYREYLEDKIAIEIGKTEAALAELAEPILTSQLPDTQSLTSELEEVDDESDEIRRLRALLVLADALRRRLEDRTEVSAELVGPAGAVAKAIDTALLDIRATLGELRKQSQNRTEELQKKEKELIEYEARVELSKSWLEVMRVVEDARRSDKLSKLAKKLPVLLRRVTELSKIASDQLINRNFGQLFEEECKALRAPPLKLEFVGREGKAQRRKVLAGKHRPSKVLSEGEQKVVAISDFLAEARLIGITAPIIFDDPVSSLDHRHIEEVADRVTVIAQANQVIVFTHDILFATSLLHRFEGTTRCTYYQVTDEDGKGKVTRATGPRWDSLGNLKKHVDETIATAKKLDGTARAALVMTGYDWLRSWCEVFVERELLAAVTERYQPNVRMTAIATIKPSALPAAFGVVTTTFERACRFIDGHSQPLVTQGVAPTLANLEEDWRALCDCQKAYRAASN
jgi:ABC-type transport system involved in cytochrome c biogenesis ATPase subunit